MLIRQATLSDIPGMFSVRLAVRENALSSQQLQDLGITPESIADALRGNCNAWVAEHGGQVVAFSLADAEERSLFALCVQPEFEGLKLGKRLLAEAVQWLWQAGAQRVWLETAENSRAAGFYRYLGWQAIQVEVEGDIGYELQRPATASDSVQAG